MSFVGFPENEFAWEGIHWGNPGEAAVSHVEDFMKPSKIYPRYTQIPRQNVDRREQSLRHTLTSCPQCDLSADPPGQPVEIED